MLHAIGAWLTLLKMFLVHPLTVASVQNELDAGSQITLFQIFAGSFVIASLVASALYLLGMRRAKSGRKNSQSATKLLATIASLTGVLMLLEAGVTLLWQEPFSALIGKSNQRALEAKLQIDETPEQMDQATARRTAYRLAKQFKTTVKSGDAVGTISIPKLNVKFTLVYGTDTESLKKGPGVFSTQPLPGMRGTSAIAGHRTTYLAPFKRIDQLAAGDKVVVTMPYGRFEYRMEDSQSVPPTQVSVLDDRGYERVALSACDPPFSAARRLVVSNKLERITIFKKRN